VMMCMDGIVSQFEIIGKGVKFNQKLIRGLFSPHLTNLSKPLHSESP
jgi:hypothetical protein